MSCASCAAEPARADASCLRGGDPGVHPRPDVQRADELPDDGREQDRHQPRSSRRRPRRGGSGPGARMCQQRSPPPGRSSRRPMASTVTAASSSTSMFPTPAPTAWSCSGMRLRCESDRGHRAGRYRPSTSLGPDRRGIPPRHGVRARAGSCPWPSRLADEHQRIHRRPGILAAIAELASTAPAERRDGWFTLFREWEAKNSSVDLFRGADIPGAVALAAVEHGPDATAPTQRSTYFASMDRLVHRAPGWTAAVAMCSNRIAAYEATEVENIWGSRTGNSMRYLFVDDAPEPFDDHFWSTLDYSRPPGTTNHATAHEPRPTRGSDSNVPQNEWTVGMVHDAYSVAAMHQTGLDGDAPECRRLTVATADRLIELVSDITSEHRAFTTVENRMFPAGVSSDLVIDGEQIRDETNNREPCLGPPRWRSGLHLPDRRGPHRERDHPCGQRRSGLSGQSRTSAWVRACDAAGRPSTSLTISQIAPLPGWSCPAYRSRPCARRRRLRAALALLEVRPR